MKRYQLDKTKFLSETELERLTASLSRLRARHPRDTLMLELLLKTGARASEMLALTSRDLDQESQTVFIKGLKGSDNREIPLSGELFSRLDAFAKETLSGEPIFKISYKRLFQIWQEFRPSPKKLHSLRHTFAIELYKKHRDLRLVQVALGHRNINNTIVYADYVFKSEELRRLVV